MVGVFASPGAGSVVSPPVVVTCLFQRVTVMNWTFDSVPKPAVTRHNVVAWLFCSNFAHAGLRRNHPQRGLSEM